MGIDKSLHDAYPSIIINGSRYHFGRHPGPEYDYYLVENANIAKDYWWFQEKEDFVAFLVNLPESADRNRMRKLYPDWSEVTPEQRHAYIEDSRARLRASMQEKIAAGTAKTYPVYPDDGSGPYDGKELFRVTSAEPPLQRVERHIREYKESHQPPTEDSPLPKVLRGLMDHSFGNGLTEAGKLSVLEHMDWEGVSSADKERILAREVNFKGMTREQFEFVYEDLSMDRDAPPDDSMARKLFEQGIKSDAGASKISIADLKAEGKGKQPERQKTRDKEREM